jgi:hypothetical protein
MTDNIKLKSQRKTKNLGFNTANTQDTSYALIETRYNTKRCSCSSHNGERNLPIRQFYLNNGGKGKELQDSCITCQKIYRANRIKRCRESFVGKTKAEIYDIYQDTYGLTKTCSKCKEAKQHTEFPTSISMETGLHNFCSICSLGNSQGNGGLRDFLYMPDKDGIKYKKKELCERCGGNNRLAVDHILPIAKGGTDCINNKQTLCIHCNSKKSDTIDCIVKLEYLCDRYKDTSLVFTDNTAITLSLSKKVYDFIQSHIYNATITDIRTSVKEYIKSNNLGNNLDRIVEKIATRFQKI